MNERIKELVVESGNGVMRDGKLYPHIGSRTQEDWEKFALLIVAKCAGIYSCIDNGNLHMGTDDYLEALHKTFLG